MSMKTTRAKSAVKKPAKKVTAKKRIVAKKAKRKTARKVDPLTRDAMAYVKGLRD